MNYKLSISLRNDSTQREGEPLRLLIIGSRKGVTETIHMLHSLGYAEAGAWSRLLPTPNSDEMMSILTRYRQP